MCICARILIPKILTMKADHDKVANLWVEPEQRLKDCLKRKHLLDGKCEVIYEIRKSMQHWPQEPTFDNTRIEYNQPFNESLPPSTPHNYLRECIDTILSNRGLTIIYKCDIRWTIIESYTIEILDIRLGGFGGILSYLGPDLN